MKIKEDKEREGRRERGIERGITAYTAGRGITVCNSPVFTLTCRMRAPVTILLLISFRNSRPGNLCTEVRLEPRPLYQGVGYISFNWYFSHGHTDCFVETCVRESEGVFISHREGYIQL